MKKKAHDISFINILYRKTPPFFQNLMFSGYGFIKAVNYLSPSLREKISYLEKTQWLKPEEIKKIQLGNFKKIISHAYKNVPYYHRLFKENNIKPEDIKSFEDFQQIPILRKEIVAKEFDNLMAKTTKTYRPVLYHTGGTTGKPLSFLMDKEMLIFREAEKYRYWRLHGHNFRDKMAILRGRVLVSNPNSNKKPWRHDYIQNFHYLSSYHLSEEIMDRYIELLHKLKPKYLQAYPSAAYVFARHVLKRGATLERLRLWPSLILNWQPVTIQHLTTMAE